MTLASGTAFGPYQISGFIGAGGMGAVYRARDTRIGRDVAIKVIHAEYANDPERLRRFEQEARATGSLNHPNILSLFDVGTEAGSPYIVSELLEGSTLRERLAKGPLRGKKGLEFATQIAHGLAAAHQKGIIHRDLKPENLFLTRDGRAKILDFGLAKLAEVSPSSSVSETQSYLGETKTGSVVGTAGYMAPEQVRGESVSERSDIFSFGAILFEMYAGKKAFSGPSAVETLHAILTADPAGTPLGDVPRGLGAIITRCLEKDPRNRFQTASDLVFSLEAIRDAPIVSDARPLLWPPRWLRGRSAAMLGLGFVAAVLIGVAAMKLGSRGAASGAPSPVSYTRLTFRQGNIAEARFTPDSQTVVYGAAWDGKPMQIFTARVDGPDSRPLGLPLGSLFAISAQGILAISEGCELSWGKCRGTLAEVSLAGGAPRRIADGVDWADWSPDGKELAIVRAVEGRYRIEFPIGHIVYQTSGWISNLRVSPDGRLLAFADHPDLSGSGGAVVIVDRSGKRVAVSEGWKIAFGMAWRTKDELWFNGSQTTRTVQLWGLKRDGTQRHILSSAGDFEIVDIARDGRALFFRTNIRTRLFTGSGAREQELTWFDWPAAVDLSDDGRTLLFSESGDAARGAPQVYVRTTDGADATRVGEGRPLALSPDARWVVAAEGTKEQQLVLLPTGVGEKRLLPRGEVTEFYSATFFPDGNRLLIAGEGKDHVPASFVATITVRFRIITSIRATTCCCGQWSSHRS